jgi:hypothetical protein
MKINEKRLKNIRRRIFYRSQTSPDVKRQKKATKKHQKNTKNIKKKQKASADENLTN